MKKKKRCKKCGSDDIISDIDILPFCNDCGYIQNQKKAKERHEKDCKEFDSLYKEESSL